MVNLKHDGTPLREVVYRLIKAGRTSSPEFEKLRAFFSDEKLRELYKEQEQIEKEKLLPKEPPFPVEK